MRKDLVTASGFKWIDFTGPTKKDLSELKTKYELPEPWLKDCLAPLHLPKFEQSGKVAFVIVRAADQAGAPLKEADTIVELTRKVGIFIGVDFIITVHSAPIDFLNKLQEKWADTQGSTNELGNLIAYDVIRDTILSYEIPLWTAEAKFEEFEDRVLNEPGAAILFEDLYFFKRKISVYKRVLWQNLDIFLKMAGQSVRSSPYLQDLREEGERIYAHSDELIEDISNLFTTHISMASHRTSEVMRVLTLFSVFFMPLTFVVGVYGMNFEHMPELKAEFGYAMVWLLMLGISAGIYCWFRKKGWMGGAKSAEFKGAALPSTENKTSL